MDPTFDWLSVLRPLRVAAVELCSRAAARPRESFVRRFCVEGTHGRPDMFELVYGDRNKQWPPITCEWPPAKTEIFAWIPPWEFKWLTTSAIGGESLHCWLSQLNM